MFKTVCPPIKVIKGVQDGLLATLLGRTLIKRPEADSGPLSWALACAVSSADFSEFQLPGWRQRLSCAAPTASEGGERHLPPSWVTYHTWVTHSLRGQNRRAPERTCVCVCVGVVWCVWERVSVHSPVFTDKPGPSWGSDTLLGTVLAELRNKPLSHHLGSHGWMRWKTNKEGSHYHLQQHG